MSKTVKVRIAVAVDSGGNWSSAGWGGEDEAELANSASSCLPGDASCERLFWLTAELPIPEVPEATEIAATVERVEESES